MARSMSVSPHARATIPGRAYFSMNSRLEIEERGIVWMLVAGVLGMGKNPERGEASPRRGIL
jgi:hypothetical protein